MAFPPSKARAAMAEEMSESEEPSASESESVDPEAASEEASESVDPEASGASPVPPPVKKKGSAPNPLAEWAKAYKK